jgi:hypothetical protein
MIKGKVGNLDMIGARASARQCDAVGELLDLTCYPIGFTPFSYQPQMGNRQDHSPVAL